MNNITWKKFNLVVGITLAILLLLVATANFFLDPGGIYWNRIQAKKYLRKYVKTLIKEDLGLKDIEFNKRELKLEMSKYSGEYQCVVLGSSHIQYLTVKHSKNNKNLKEECSSLINLWVGGKKNNLEDFLALSHMIITQEKKPSKILIEISPWVFDIEENTYNSSTDIYFQNISLMLNILKVKTNASTSLYTMKKIIGLLNYGYLKEALLSTNFLTSTNKKYFFNLSDGSQNKKTYERDIYNMNYRFDDKKAILDENKIVIFKLLLKKLKTYNIEPILLVTPFHNRAFNNNKLKDKIKLVYKTIKKISIYENIRLYGSYKNSDIKCLDKDFNDLSHTYSSCLDKVLKHSANIVDNRHISKELPTSHNNITYNYTKWDDYFFKLIENAKNEDAESQYKLSQIYKNGKKNILKNSEKYFYYLKKSAENNFYLAIINMAYYYKKENNIPKYVKWLNKGVAMDLRSSIHNLGAYYSNNKEFNKAIPLLIRSGDKGEDESYGILGNIFFNRKDYKKAFYYFSLASNIVNAQFSLGYMYQNGLGIDKNISKAIDRYTRAAKQGNKDSQAILGEIYFASKDYEKSIKWNKLAAKQGSSTSQYGLGLIYYKGGYGIKKNIDIAIKWFKLAAEQGNKEAINALKQIVNMY